MKLSIITATYNRPDKLKTTAIPSLLNQSDCDFEWVVVNDGANPHTKAIVERLDVPFSINYVEIKHHETGFGLCHARNAGIEAAMGDLISYIDDDNSLFPEFVASTKLFFKTNPSVKYSMALQSRRRDIVRSNKTVSTGKTFISPDVRCTIEELISQDQIFNSNGFAHHNNSTLVWNPNLKVFADYDFLLQCVSLFDRKTFQINPQILVSYIQSSEGAIGSSTYEQWGRELKQIVDNSFKYNLHGNEVDKLIKLSHKYLAKGDKRVIAFIDNE